MYNIGHLSHDLICVSMVYFELTGQTESTNKGNETREWKNKHYGWCFWQQKNGYCKSFNTCVFHRKKCRRFLRRH